MNKKLKKARTKNKKLKAERELLELAIKTLAQILKRISEEKEYLLKQKNTLKDIFNNFIEVKEALEKRIEDLETQLRSFKTQE